MTTDTAPRGTAPGRPTSTRKLNRRLLGLALPNFFALITVPLAGLVDLAMLGHLDEMSHLAGVGLASVLFDYVYWSLSFVETGTQGVTAQAQGRKDKHELSLVLYRALALALLMGLAVLALSPAIRALGFSVLAGSEAAEASGRAYFDARIWAAPAVLVNLAFVGWLLGRGRSRTVLFVTLVITSANVALDYYFIYTLGLASRGAGIATAMSQYLGLLLYLLVLFKVDRGWLTSAAGFADRETFKRLFALNRDIMIRTLCLVSVFASFINISAAIGTVTLAANAILLNLFYLVAYAVDSFALSLHSLAGISKGRNDAQATRRLLSLAMAWGMVIALLAVALLWAAPQTIFALITSHGDIVAAMMAYRGWLYATLLLGAVAFIYDGLFLGLTEGAVLRNAMLASTLLVYTPLALLAQQRASVSLLWAAMVLFMGARAISLGSRQKAAIERCRAPVTD